ncbi:hypothetical protein ACWDQZ_27185 [Streptomyces tendae]
MATNTTPKKAPARADEPTEAETVTAEARPKRTTTTIAPAVVGPAPLTGVEPVKVRLSHHLGIGGNDYQPGTEILVSPDYARRLRTQGYVART